MVSHKERLFTTMIMNGVQEYEGAVEDRNHTGIMLIDRNDELCILYEKANTQEEVMHKGEHAYTKLCHGNLKKSYRQNPPKVPFCERGHPHTCLATFCAHRNLRILMSGGSQREGFCVCLLVLLTPPNTLSWER